MLSCVIIVVVVCLSMSELLLVHAEYFEAFRDEVTGKVASKVTVVSGHWTVGVSATKHPLEYYRKWWRKTMILNCPYIIFGEDLAVIHHFRDIRQNHSLPTLFVYRNITEHMYPRFPDYKSQYRSRVIPSKEVAMIWLDKIFMIQEAIRLNPFNSEWFAWNDAGNAAFRGNDVIVNPPLNPTIPWPHPNALAALPKDKFVYTLSWIPWKRHSVAGTAFIYHQSIQETLAKRFMIAFDACLEGERGWNKSPCGSDQVILSRVKNEYQSFFHQIGYGYGHLITRMFMDHDPGTNITGLVDLCYEQNFGVDKLKSFRVKIFRKQCAGIW
mmetsp:Transcript_7007/g.11716  ORF Transcript_7007/g.11716 Transcript_7007/m.11716 type:complete len:326 (+) Transcript_7007:240-1217(+)